MSVRLSLLQSPPKGLATADKLLGPFSREHRGWCLDTLAGRYTEIADGATGAALTVVCGIILEAQQRGEIVAWIGRKNSTFFPPDFATAGIDLGALLVVFASNLTEGLRATDILFRSGGVGVLVFDLGKSQELPLTVQSQFVKLAKEYHVAFLEIKSDREQKTRGSLASLRVIATKERIDRDFRVEIRASKDRFSGAGWQHTEICHGPDGLR